MFPSDRNACGRGQPMLLLDYVLSHFGPFFSDLFSDRYSLVQEQRATVVRRSFPADTHALHMCDITFKDESGTACS